MIENLQDNFGNYLKPMKYLTYSYGQNLFSQQDYSDAENGDIPIVLSVIPCTKKSIINYTINFLNNLDDLGLSDCHSLASALYQLSKSWQTVTFDDLDDDFIRLNDSRTEPSNNKLKQITMMLKQEVE